MLAKVIPVHAYVEHAIQKHNMIALYLHCLYIEHNSNCSNQKSLIKVVCSHTLTGIMMNSQGLNKISFRLIRTLPLQDIHIHKLVWTHAYTHTFMRTLPHQYAFTSVPSVKNTQHRQSM